MSNKPVWRLNTGNGVPSDLGSNTVYKTRGGVDTWKGYSTGCVLWEIWNDHNDILFYQTNRTRKAKYRG